jgi:hypothetical protein
MKYLGQVQNLDWVSPSRLFATTKELLDSQPNYENEVAVALDTKTKYRGISPVIGGWGYANGSPGPFFPSDPPVQNDVFTKLLLEEEGIEGSTTHYDTNAAGWPRVWTHATVNPAHFGSITNVDERFGEGSLKLDGRTVITAPDSVDFTFKLFDFRIRGSFLCDFPAHEPRVLFAKTHRWQFATPRFEFNVPMLEYMFFFRRTGQGYIEVGVHTNQVFADYILTRFNDYIVGRWGEVIVSRHDPNYQCDSMSTLRDRWKVEIVDRDGELVLTRDYGIRAVQSTRIFTDEVNPGWHEFEFFRANEHLTLLIDGVTEDTGEMCAEFVNEVPCPITIGGYGDPRVQRLDYKKPFSSRISTRIDDQPWKGGLDRLAVDIQKGNR